MKRYEWASISFGTYHLRFKCTNNETLTKIMNEVKRLEARCQFEVQEKYGEVQVRKLKSDRNSELAWHVFKMLCHSGWMPLRHVSSDNFELRLEVAE